MPARNATKIPIITQLNKASPTPITYAPLRLGIAGAGTMGAGIAATAQAAGVPVLLHDPDPAARERAPDLDWAARIGDLAPCDVVIEAAGGPRRRRGSLARRAGAGARARRGAGQARDRGRRRARLPSEPLQPPV